MNNMRKELINVEFYFPEKKNVRDNKELANLIAEKMREKDSISYSGYKNEKILKKGLIQHISKGSISNYKVISEKKKEKIIKIIKETIEKCEKKLPLPTKNYIFVFPYLPTEDERVFRGVTGVALYSCVFHIFLNHNILNSKALSDTVAHELNHTIFYYNHFDNFEKYNLLDEMIIEGLAENFREQIINFKQSPWTKVLNKKEAFSFLDNNKNILSSKDGKIIKNVLFGNKKHKKWTGYSVGYWLVKEYINRNPKTSWKELMKKESKDFLKIREKKEA